MSRLALTSLRAGCFRAVTFAMALAALAGGLAAEALSSDCDWIYDPAIGQPGLSSPGSGSAAYAFALDQGDLVVCGYFANAGGLPASNAARWDGTQFTPMGQGFSSSVYTLDWFHGSLYAFGQFLYAWPHTAWRAARWDGTNWQALGADQGLQRPSDIQFGEANVSIVYGDSLVVGGGFTRAGDQPVGLIAAWDGEGWHPIGAGFDTVASVAGTCQWAIHPSIFALAEYNGDLIAGGSFQLTATGDTVQCIARWDGTSWQPMGRMGGGQGTSSHACPPPWVHALTVWNGDLIVGGSFQTADGVAAARVARWDGTSWHAMGSGWNTNPGGSTVWALAVTESNELIAGGWAQNQGIPLNKWQLTRWNGTDWEQLGPDLTWISTPAVRTLFPWGPDVVVDGAFTGNTDGTAMSYISILRCNSSVDVPVASLSDRFGLRVAGPNPFFGSTAIAFDLPADAERMTLEVHDLAGRRVRTLHAGPAAAGEHVVRWQGGRDDGSPTPAGVYFARLEVGDETRSLRMVRLR